MNNCVGNNNHRHFVFYLLALETGIVLFVRLVLDCRYSSYFHIWALLRYADLEIREAPKEFAECAVISPELCKVLNKDPFTIVLAIWATFQLTWVTMLLCVQLLQIARNLTTYESMRGHLNSHTAANAVNSFVTTGDISQEVSSGGNAPTNGFGSGQDTGDAPRRREPKASILDQWKRLLGIDTFVTIAFHGSQGEQMRRQRQGNPFSRGMVTNCKDFWCDASPVFGSKESGYARLGGERVDYTRLYEVPKMKYQRNGGGEGGRYESVAGEEEAS